MTAYLEEIANERYTKFVASRQRSEVSLKGAEELQANLQRAKRHQRRSHPKSIFYLIFHFLEDKIASKFQFISSKLCVKHLVNLLKKKNKKY